MANKKIYDLIDVVGSQNIDKISIVGLRPMELYDIEMEYLIKLTQTIKKRRSKEKLMVSKKELDILQELVGANNLHQISIVGITPNRMDEEELQVLNDLVRMMKLRKKGFKVVSKRWKLDGEWIQLAFDYHPRIVDMVSKLPTSEWKKEKKCWYVHVSDWTDVEEIFRVTQPDIEILYQKWKEDRKVNRLKMTNQGCYLTGLNLPFKEIHLATSFPDPNARHISSFQNGSWDGRVALFDRATGFLPYGLLGKVLSVLQKLGTKYELTDERKRPNLKFNFENNVKLRDYQEVVKEKAMSEGRGILQLATGAGKTKTASSIISSYGLNTIFFVHTKFLLGQAKEALEEVLGEEIGQVGDGIVDIKPVTVAMVQTTIKALGGEYEPSDDDQETDPSQLVDETNIEGKEEEIVNMLEQAEVVFFDECQFVAANTFYTIANYCRAYYKFGLSATPYRSDKKDLMIEAALGPIIHKINASYLIKRDFLTRPKIHFFKVGGLVGGDNRKYQTVYKEDIVENVERNRLIIQSTQRLNRKNKSVLILVQQVNHGKFLQEMFRQEGMDVEFVSGEDDLKRREEEVYKLRTKKVLALIATTIADEGLDVPSLDAVILGGGGKSPSKGMQRVGRAIRIFSEREESFELLFSSNDILSEGKNLVIVVDDIERGRRLEEYLKMKDKDKPVVDIDFLYGEKFKKHKETVFNKLAERKMQGVIVYAGDVTEEEIEKITPLDSLLVSGGEKFNAQAILRTPRNVKEVIQNPDNLDEDALELSKHILELSNQNQSTLILVDETKQGKALKQSLSQLDKKVKFLTGAKQTQNLGKEVQDLIQSSSEILIVNSNYVEEALDYHLIDNIFLCGVGKKPYTSISKVQKDVRIFTKKEEAYVVDFIDNSKYLYNHSLERKLMFETEVEFDISGWN